MVRLKVLRTPVSSVIETRPLRRLAFTVTVTVRPAATWKRPRPITVPPRLSVAVPAQARGHEMRSLIAFAPTETPLSVAATGVGVGVGVVVGGGGGCRRGRDRRRGRAVAA